MTPNATTPPLVERLKDQASLNGGQGAYAWQARELCRMAAARIEQLERELVEARAVIGQYMSAVEALGKSPPGRKDNYFEAPLSADGAIERWQELDRAGKAARTYLERNLHP